MKENLFVSSNVTSDCVKKFLREAGVSVCIFVTIKSKPIYIDYKQIEYQGFEIVGGRIGHLIEPCAVI